FVQVNMIGYQAQVIPAMLAAMSAELWETMFAGCGKAGPVVSKDANHISSMGFETDILKHIRAFLIRKSQIMDFHQMCSAMRTRFFLIMLRITLRVCCPQTVGNACFFRQ